MFSCACGNFITPADIWYLRLLLWLNAETLKVLNTVYKFEQIQDKRTLKSSYFFDLRSWVSFSSLSTFFCDNSRTDHSYTAHKLNCFVVCTSVCWRDIYLLVQASGTFPNNRHRSVIVHVRWYLRYWMWNCSRQWKISVHLNSTLEKSGLSSQFFSHSTFGGRVFRLGQQWNYGSFLAILPTLLSFRIGCNLPARYIESVSSTNTWNFFTSQNLVKNLL